MIYIYIYIYIYVCVCVCVCHRHGKGIGKEMNRFAAFVIFGGSNVDAGRCADEPWWFQCACAVVFLLED